MINLFRSKLERPGDAQKLSNAFVFKYLNLFFFNFSSGTEGKLVGEIRIRLAVLSYTGRSTNS